MTEKDNYGFELIRDEQIAELNSRARIYRHIQTGAELISLENDDENKAFGIVFRTPPKNSTGVAHIIEHSVLCGSRKYPVKEPFTELMKGSLNTFLNAFTGPDFTVYPVASQNVQDFYNLVDVYLDAVFFPLLTPYTLLQEGWHYELDDPHNPLAYKGVVFNEMKGAYSSPEGVLSDEIQRSLFPDTVYHFDSGGDPVEIPDLTYEEFKSFHETYYHPSNARIFFYGDDDPETRLVITHEYLHLFDPIPVESRIPLQPPFFEPRRAVVPYEISEEQQDAKAFVTVNWLLPETGDTELVFGLSILEYALIGTPASQIRKALIDSGLGQDLTGSGLETSSRQMYFSTGLKGVEPQNADKVEKLIIDTAADLALHGVDPDNIKAAINTLEFRLRENNTGSFPRGLVVMLRAQDFWLHDKDPLAPLAFEAPLNAIKERLAAGEPYFEHLIEAYLVNNTHRTTVILTPDPHLGEQRAAAERERLDQARVKMSEQEIAEVIDTTQRLKIMQETPDSPEALMTIPMLELNDLDREIRRIPIEALQEGQTKVLSHDLFTNGILYIDLGFDMHVLPQEWIPYIPLFSRALTETGTHKESFVQLLQRIGQNTGGIRATTLASGVRNTGKSIAWLFLRGKAMAGQTRDLLAILSDILTDANLEDRERFRQMALEERARMESRVINGGAGIVNSRLSAHFDEAAWASEQMGGASYLFFLRQLNQQIEQDWPAVLKTMQSIRDVLLNGTNAICNITIDAANWKTLQPQVNDFLSNLPARTAAEQKWTLPEMPSSEGLTIPTQVNYVGKGADLFELGYQLKGSSFVVNKHINDSYMWNKVRVQGGAYGGFSNFDTQSGILNFISYRDPNLLKTLEIYNQTGDYLKNLEIDESELTKVIIGTIGDLDAYLLPDAKGFTSMRWYLLGTTDEERQRLRNEVLNTSIEDFHQFGEYVSKIKDHGVVSVLGVDEAVQAAGIFQEVQKVL